jgi:hypothetical protein
MGSVVLVASLAVILTLVVIRLGNRSDDSRGRTPEKKEATPESTPQQSAVIAYKTVASMRIPLEHNKRILWISFEPGNFVRDQMIMLAHQLNQDFRDEPRIFVVIFDSEIAARNYNPAGGSYEVSKKLERGEYSLDRINGREYIQFSTARGKPITEVRIDLRRY